MKKNWFNWRKFFVTFGFTYACLLAVFVLGGCTAAWIDALSAMIPGIAGVVSAIVSFVSALEGKTVSATFSATIQKWATNVQSLLSELQTLVASATSATTTTVMAQIQAVLSQLSQSLGTILADSGITDEGTLTKIEELFSLFAGAINAVLALIPLALARVKAGASTAELEKADGDAKDSINSAHKALKTAYHSVVTQTTPSIPVNEALATLPQQLQ